MKNSFDKDLPDHKNVHKDGEQINPSESDKKNEKSEKNEDSGLPDIGQAIQKDRRAFLVLFALLLMGVFYLVHTGSPSELDKTEQFNVEKGAPPLQEKKSSLNDKDKSQTEMTETVIKDEIKKNQNAEDIQKALLARLQAPVMVNQNNNVSSQTQTPDVKNKASQELDAHTAFLNQVSTQATETVQASVLKDRRNLIAEGNLIHAVLETAVNSDLPGMLRAIVSEPVYAEDGSQILIPSGSRLIGQYKSGLQTGESRVFVVWQRLIEPNGISLTLGSPGVDNLGVAGQGADSIDRHFWQVFGTASLLSILGAGASNLDVGSDPYNASQAYRQAISTSLAQSAQTSLQRNTQISPTLHINQGTPVMVFIAKDLRFDQAMSKTQQKIAVF